MPPPRPTPEPVTLFYPVESNQNLPNFGGFWIILLVPFLLFLAIFPAVIVFFLPTAFIACKLNGIPFTFNIPKLIANLEAYDEEQKG